MKQPVLIGQTDYTVLVLMRDDAGAPATGLTEASVDIAYARVETDNDVTITDVTPAALTALTDAHTDWGFEEVHATDAPGLYRLDIADAVFASGAWSSVVTVTGTGLDPAHLEFVLVAVDPKAATMPANYIAATSITNDAFTAAKFHSDVTTELQSGLATAAALDAVDNFLDTEVAAILSDTNAILVDTGTTLDGKIDAIGAKTTNLPSDPADQSAVEAAITSAIATLSALLRPRKV